VSERSGKGGVLLMLGAIAASLVLVGTYLAAGGASYAPAKTQDPCKHRPWSNPEGLQQIIEQFSISANSSRSATGSGTRSWPGRYAPACCAP
jgi:hypothetical protein